MYIGVFLINTSIECKAKIKFSTEEKNNCVIHLHDFEVAASFGDLLYKQSLSSTEIISDAH